MTSEDWVKVLSEDGTEAALLAYCDWLSDQEGWEDAAEAARGLPALVAEVRQTVNEHLSGPDGAKLTCSSSPGHCHVERPNRFERFDLPDEHSRVSSLIANVASQGDDCPGRAAREWFQAALDASLTDAGQITRGILKHLGIRYAQFHVRAEVAREEPSLSDAVPF